MRKFVPSCTQSTKHRAQSTGKRARKITRSVRGASKEGNKAKDVPVHALLLTTETTEHTAHSTGTG